MKLHLLGGFLGAGKTTLARALARRLTDQGERVAIITNDQGQSLVDTVLCREVTSDVREIVGGCFCCKYDELESALDAAAEAHATVVIAEAVGSCTDLVATVLSPLADRHPGRLTLAPLTVVVDPWRVAEMDDGGFSDEVAYLFRKQIEEADVVVLSRRDLDPPDVRPAIRAIRGDVPIVAVAAQAGEGLGEWLAVDQSSAAPLSIDYDRYAAAEAELGWSNARVRLTGDEPFDVGEAIERFLGELRDTPVAHVKVTSIEPPGFTAALVRSGGEPLATTSSPPMRCRDSRWLVNARVALEPEELSDRLHAALDRAAGEAAVEWEEISCFRPGRPEPTHRYAFRCGTGDDAACCAAFYDRPDVRYFLGDSLHPGGVDLTLRMAERLSLAPGDKVLDVACGHGTSLRAVLDVHPVEGVGLDTGAVPIVEDRLTILVGDAHAVPALDDSVAAVLCECALSTFADQARALTEIYRVLRPGGRVAVSDMVVAGPIPESLRDWVHAGTCLSGAQTLKGYANLLAEAGLTVREQWDASDALQELLRGIKRKLVGAALASAVGGTANAPFDVRAARGLLREAEGAVASGAIGYGVVIAEKEA